MAQVSIAFTRQIIKRLQGDQQRPPLETPVMIGLLPISAGILISLFLVQSRGTASMARYFGPITALWFLTRARTR